MIPKIIHYCWFGRNPKPELMQRCIASWKKYCPDYALIEWNEDNFDLSQNDYAREAYAEGKWAFVTDYARLWIVFHYGGIYLDTDVELLKPLNALLHTPAFFGFEDTQSIATGLGFGAEKGNPVVGAMLDDYRDIHFRLLDGSFDQLPCPIRNTKSIAHLFPEHMDPTSIVNLTDAVLYPPEFFCPLSADGKSLKKTKRTYSIHWYSATWLSDDERVVHQWRLFKTKCERLFGPVIGGYVARGVYLFLPQKRAVLKRM